LSAGKYDSARILELIQEIVEANGKQEFLTEGQASPLPGLMRSLCESLRMSKQQLGALISVSTATIMRWTREGLTGVIQPQTLARLRDTVEIFLQSAEASDECAVLAGNTIGIWGSSRLIEAAASATEMWMLVGENSESAFDADKFRFALKEALSANKQLILYLVHFAGAISAREAFEHFADFAATPERVRVIPVSRPEELYALGISKVSSPLIVFVYGQGSATPQRVAVIFQEQSIVTVDKVTGEPSGQDYSICFVQLGDAATLKCFDALVLAFRKIRSLV
jgi:hypothetical protein